MDFSFSPEQEILRKTIRQFAEKEITPLIEEAEEKHRFPIEILPKMGKLGYLGVSFPAECGGSGNEDISIRKIDECIVLEEMSRVCAGIAFGIQAAVIGAPNYIIRDFGNDEQKRKYLAPAIKGEKIGAFSLTEPNAGSDAASIRTTAVSDGDFYVLNGNKIFCTNGNIADYITVAVYTDKEKGVKGGISIIVVEKGAPGFSVGQKFKKIGHRSAENAELIFEDCRVPQANIIGEEGRGWPMLMAALNESRVSDSARAVGVAQAALEAALTYAKERTQFGKPIGKFQAVAFKLAHMHTQIEAARSLTYKAAWLLGQKKDIRLEISTARLFAAEMVSSVTTQALETFGGYGFIEDFPVQRYWRDARLFYFGYGTEEIQKLVISRALGM
nr:acyl-CoA dehydrogenase [Desulfobacterales bacterium]